MGKKPPANELSPAKQKLLAQIREQRERLGPELLERAAEAIKAEKRNAAETTVPYDKKSASKAIRMFLDNHKNAPAFEKKLIEQLKKEDAKK